MIKILIVDDSITETAILKQIIESENDLRVIGCAKNGEEGVLLAEKLKPDLITMDIHMPGMNGFEAIHQIMMRNPVPVVVISSKLDDEELNATYEAFEAGALSVMNKPIDINSSLSSQSRKKITDTIRNMAEIKVIKKRFLTRNSPYKTLPPDMVQPTSGQYEIVAIGSSVGGPQALNKVLSGLTKEFPVPIVIVQHMTPGFIDGFTEWLGNRLQIHVKTAKQGEPILSGHVYFAPDGYHLEVLRINNQLTANLVKGKPVSGFCPSVTVLLNSVVKSCGKNAIAVLLTGMGSDGADGMLELKKCGAHTLIQDPESAIVFGMASVAQSLGAVDKVVELHKLADYLKLSCRSLVKL